MYLLTFFIIFLIVTGVFHSLVTLKSVLSSTDNTLMFVELVSLVNI